MQLDTSNGTLDASFDTDGNQTSDLGDSDEGYSMALQTDGKIVLAGFTAVGTGYQFAVVRYTNVGSLDNTFNGIGKRTIAVSSDKLLGNSVAIQSTGNIVIAGYTLNGHYNDFIVIRLNIIGSLDTTFDTDGMVTTDFTAPDDYAGSVVIQGDDKIVLTGYSYIFSCFRTKQGASTPLRITENLTYYPSRDLRALMHLLCNPTESLLQPASPGTEMSMILRLSDILPMEVSTAPLAMTEHK